MRGVTCWRVVTFDAGHRLLGHEGKCAHLHGHTYRVEFGAAADQLDPVGRIVDFSVLKAALGGWVERYWDHGFLFNVEDSATANALAYFDAGRRDIEARTGIAPGEPQKSYALPYNPTAENIARYLGEVVGPSELSGTGVRLVRVVVWETPNCRAEWTAPAEADEE